MQLQTIGKQNYDGNKREFIQHLNDLNSGISDLWEQANLSEL